MPLTVGGQAVIEGVMLRSPNAVAVSVRKADGSIKSKVYDIRQPSQRFLLFRWPFVRGIATLWDSLSLGIRCLNFSAQEALHDESLERKKKGTFWPFLFSMLAAIGIGFVLFFVLPHLFTELLGSQFPVLKDSGWLFSLADGTFRLMIFLLYILGISLMPDIRRVFRYHGAEHKVVHAYESSGKVTVESARTFGVLHRRCGTSFLLILLVLVVLLFSFVPHEEDPLSKAATRLKFLPIVLLLAAGISYELLRLSAKASDSVVVRAMTAPGLLLQRLVTKQPSDEQVEVAIAALCAVLGAEDRLREERKSDACDGGASG